MMTQPIQMFENLTSETSPAGGNALTKMGFSFEDRRLIERGQSSTRGNSFSEWCLNNRNGFHLPCFFSIATAAALSGRSGIITFAAG